MSHQCNWTTSSASFYRLAPKHGLARDLGCPNWWRDITERLSSFKFRPKRENVAFLWERGDEWTSSESRVAKEKKTGRRRETRYFSFEKVRPFSDVEEAPTRRAARQPRLLTPVRLAVSMAFPEPLQVAERDQCAAPEVDLLRRPLLPKRSRQQASHLVWVVETPTNEREA